MFYYKLPYPINSIINKQYITWLEKTDVVDTFGIRISYLRKWAKSQYLDFQRQENEETISSLLDNPHQWGNEPEKRKKRKFYKKECNKQKGGKYKRKFYNKPSPNRCRFSRKVAHWPIGKK